MGPEKRIRRSGSRNGPVQAPLARDPLQDVGTSILELHTRPCHQVLHGRGHEHLAPARQPHEAGADMDRDSPDVLAGELDLSRVESGPHLQPEAPNTVSDLLGAPDRPGRAIEGSQEAVPSRVDLAASEAP